MVTISISADSPKEIAATLQVITEPPHISLNERDFAQLITSSPTHDTCEASSSSSLDSEQRCKQERDFAES